TLTITDSVGGVTHKNIAVTVTNAAGAMLTDAANALVTTFSGVSGARASAGLSIDGTAFVSRFSNSQGMAYDSKGNLFVAEADGNKIRKITPDGTSSTFAGNGTRATVNGTGTAAQMNGPVGIAIDNNDNLFVADSVGHTIRKITPAQVVTTFAGSGTASSTNGTGTAATFNTPYGLAFDRYGNLLVTEFIATNGNIRKITPSGVVSTIATGLNKPLGIAVASTGELLVSEWGGQVIDKMNADGTGKVILAGATNTTGSTNSATGASARFNTPNFMVINAADEIFVTEFANDMVRKITLAGATTTIAGTAATPGTLNGTGTAATFDGPHGIAIDRYGNLAIASAGTTNATTSAGNQIRKISFRHTLDAGVAMMGQALSFDGVDDIVQIPTPAPITTALNGASFTIEFWAKRKRSNTNEFLISQGIAATNQGLHIGWRASNQFTCAFWGNDLNTTGSYIDTSSWHHWSCNYNASTQTRTIYRDGIQVANDTTVGPYVGTGTFYIGQYIGGVFNPQVNLDEVKVWNSARSQVEIQYDMYARPDGSETGLLGYWNFDDPGKAFAATAIDL
ncbi:MAG: LamG-like jellyroll fold domain-containing protein, partial [Mariprofundales bacterium]